MSRRWLLVSRLLHNITAHVSIWRQRKKCACEFRAPKHVSKLAVYPRLMRGTAAPPATTDRKVAVFSLCRCQSCIYLQRLSSLSMAHVYSKVFIFIFTVLYQCMLFFSSHFTECDRCDSGLLFLRIWH